MDPKIERRKALQKRNRRMKSLLLKAADMSIHCDAEVVLGIRIRETGRVTTFCSDPEGLWSPITLNLVCLFRLTDLMPGLILNRGTTTLSPSI
jgi:SRF-type transcription factor (DNA-binding and dimerisation domain)